MASDAENASIWWRHHEMPTDAELREFLGVSFDKLLNKQSNCRRDAMIPMCRHQHGAEINDCNYPVTRNISRILLGYKIVVHSDEVRASPIGVNLFIFYHIF